MFVIIEIETILLYYFTKPYVLGIKECNKKTILLFYIIIMKNQNGLHEITKSYSLYI